uniref:Uncharacterized protein n=1 Tax=Anguilla anguilla TaxID=7936 RepID=A0A0E9S1Z9_ANGAN
MSRTLLYRVLTHTKKINSHNLCSLSITLVTSHIHYKLLTITFKALHRSLCFYLSELLFLSTPT